MAKRPPAMAGDLHKKKKKLKQVRYVQFDFTRGHSRERITVVQTQFEFQMFFFTYGFKAERVQMDEH